MTFILPAISEFFTFNYFCYLTDMQVFFVFITCFKLKLKTWFSFKIRNVKIKDLTPTPAVTIKELRADSTPFGFPPIERAITEYIDWLRRHPE